METPQSGAADVLWYTDTTCMEPAVPDSLASMPTCAQLLSTLHTRPGRPVTRDQITADAQVGSTDQSTSFPLPLRPSTPLHESARTLLHLGATPNSAESSVGCRGAARAFALFAY
jgi:hypothetical protein